MPGRAIVLVAVLVLAGTLTWLLAFSRVFDVADVEVVGASPEVEAGLRDAAAVPAGSSLLWLDTAGIAGRVGAVPRVARVDVRRSLPATVVVSVVEREPVLATDVGDGVALVDHTGVAFRTLPAAPPGVPLLRLAPGARAAPDDPATVAAVRVLTALPADLRRTVAEVRADGPFDVGLALADRRVVRWGADGENDRKSAVLAALLSRPGTTYDVSTPELAVVS